MSNWNEFNPNDKRLESHSSYLVTDGIFVDKAYFDTDEFVGCENDLLNQVTHWMNFPRPPVTVPDGGVTTLKENI